ncbi:boi2p [Saccharomyces arboricola H-6]|uniref:Boi2p n=1 Tax=Saccharomyces arboricola (strain H-6 / AS 2.3317 / CBS 10644) TaxID=1160507 RepID=J8LPG1_SACAR|nr:boi2p [Saccharomyces arboricola H-6]
MSTGKELPTLLQLNTTVGKDKDASVTLSPEYDSKGSANGCEGDKFSVYIAINEYFKRMEDELDMKPGDKIKVITDDEEYKDGWYFGRNLRTNEEGLYPVVFTQKITAEKTPSLMRAKSTKRVYSPLTNDDPLLSSTFISENDSNSELPTPQPIETAASISRNANGKLDRNLSLKNTICDIENALQEFKEDSVGAPDHSIASSKDEGHSITHETILSTTDGLDVIDSNSKPTTSGSIGLSSNDLEKRASLINGIDTTKLDPVEAELWTPEEITAYLIMEGYDVQSASRFQKHKISGRILLELELVHLKELDINSFGTRFEIFKEIEKIKEAIRTNSFPSSRTANANTNNVHNQLMPPANVDQRASYRGHVRKTSQSLDDLTSQQSFSSTLQSNRNSAASKHRPKSLVINSQNTTPSIAPEIQIPEDVEGMTGNEHLFVSPRRAPKPPSYPSPAQPPKSPLLNNKKVSASPTQSYSWQSPTSSYSGSKRISSIDQFSSNSNSNSRYTVSRNNQGSGKALSPIPSPTHESVLNAVSDSKDPNVTSTNRSSAVYSESAANSPNKKSSFTSDDEEENFHRPMDVYERPTSSIYADGSTFVSTNYDNLTHDEEKKKKPTRHSSLLSSKSKSDSKRDSSLKRSSSGSRTNSFRKSSFMLSPFRQQFTDNAVRSSPSPEENSNALTPSAKDSLSPTDTKSSKKNKPKKRSVSAKETIHEDFTKAVKEDKNKRSVSEAVKGETVKGKSLRQITTRPVPKKKQTSAFIEGLRHISVKEAMKNADFSGWMSKKGSGTMSTWKTRFFTLHGTRLSYFSSTTDTRERGLIDITAHRVIPAKEDDKLVSLYAASTGKGRYCFKLLPPQPGSKKGLTFTQPRTHYFAVENKEEMRGWMAALIKTTIDIDTSVPVISSYTTPTVSLSKAQEMLAEAREETKLREQQMLENEEDEDQLLWDQQQRLQQQQYSNQAGRTISESTQQTSGEDTISTPNLSSATNTTIGSNGFSSPFLLASGILSPVLARNNSMRGSDKQGKLTTEEDYFGEGSHKSDKI